MRARFASARFYINGENITPKLAPFLESVKYSDSIEGEADTVEITLTDDTHNLLKEWAPARGSSVRVELVKTSWNSRNLTEELPELVLPLGVFEVDEITDKYPPSVRVIKLNSIPNKANVRGVHKNRSWERTRLSRIAADIAGDAGLTLFYDAPDDPEVSRIEQADESDLAFLKKICTDAGLNVKVSDGKLIIFDAQKYEEKPVVFVLNYGETIILSFDAANSITNLYKDAHVHFKSNNIADFLFGMFGEFDLLEGVSGVNLSGAVEGLTGGAGDRVLEINQKVFSKIDADRLAKKKLREKNKDEIKITFNLMGSFSFCAGNTIRLQGHGMYDGKYLIDKSDHTLGSSGYTTQVSLHKCLTGY